MLFKLARGTIDNRYTTHDFDVFGSKHIIISTGDRFILEYDNEVYRPKVFGYGYDAERNVLKMFVTFDDDETWCIDMLLLTGILIQHGTIISVIGDNERYFQLRVPDHQDVRALTEYLDQMQGITIKPWWKNNKKKYRVTQEEIGIPDWFITFRYSTNFGGAASFAKIALLVNSYPGKVFVYAKNNWSPEEFNQKYASAKTFFILAGANIKPSLCIQTLKSIDNIFE